VYVDESAPLITACLQNLMKRIRCHAVTWRENHDFVLYESQG
jgi:hypothetical protein